LKLNQYGGFKNRFLKSSLTEDGSGTKAYVSSLSRIIINKVTLSFELYLV